jgi:GAF domain-containing protein
MPRTSFYEQLLAIVGNVFDAYSAVLFLPDPADPGVCRAAAAFSLGEALNREAVIAPGQGLVGWIIREKKSLLISNFDQQRGVLGYYRGGEEERIRAFMGHPVPATGGALCLDTRKTYAFGEKDLKILSQFAELAGNHLASSREVAQSLVEHGFYKAQQRIALLHKTHPKWAAFRQAFLTILAEAAGFRHVLLTVRDESGRSYFLEGANESPFLPGREAPSRFSVGQGLVGWVFKNKTPVYTGEKDEASRLPLFGLDVPTADFKSVICLPIHFSKKTRGVLTLADPRPVAVTEDLKAFVGMVSESLALFLENLHQRTRLGGPSA